MTITPILTNVIDVKAVTHQPTEMLSQVELGPVVVSVKGLQLDVLLHSGLVHDCLFGTRPAYNSTVKFG